MSIQTFTVVALDNGETWTRNTQKGAEGLADYLAYLGRGASVWRSNNDMSSSLVYVGRSEQVIQLSGGEHEKVHK